MGGIPICLQPRPHHVSPAAVVAQLSAVLYQYNTNCICNSASSLHSLAIVMLQVLEAEAAQPLVPAAALESAGALPRVLAQTEVGGELVAAPAPQERQEMYKKEQEETGKEGWCTEMCTQQFDFDVPACAYQHMPACTDWWISRSQFTLPYIASPVPFTCYRHTAATSMSLHKM